MTKNPPLPKTSDCNGSSDTTYVVGYCRPPLHTRFKPGQSGNRNGRPKRHRNVRTILENTLNQKIKIREGGETRSLTKKEAFVLTVVTAALNRDAKAQASLMALMRLAGMLDEAPEANNAEPLTTDDNAVLAEFLRRHGAAPEQFDGPQDNGSSTESPPDKEDAS